VAGQHREEGESEEMNSRPIQHFLDHVRRRIDRGNARRTGAWCLLAAAAAAVAWALGWRIFGYAAPWIGYAVAAAAGILVLAAAAVLARRSQLNAASTADDVFELKDGLLSWLEFRAEGRAGEAYQLHERSMEDHISSLEPTGVPVPRVRRTLLIGVALALVAGGLALIPHSDAVTSRLAREAATAERSAEVKKQVDEAIEKLIEDLSDEERKVLDPAKLREIAAGIEQTTDQREAEKAIARFEQQLAKAMQGLEARQDEAVLSLAAEELAKASLADVRQLGKKLDAKDYEMARKEMEAMKPNAMRKMTPKELEELRKNAAKAKEMAKRMADGARQRKFGKAPRPGDRADAKAMPMAPGQQQPLNEMLEDLDADARMLGQMMEAGEFDPDAEPMALHLGEKMDKLGDRLGLLAARRNARGKLGRLRAGMGEARKFARGQCQSLGLGQSMAQSPNAGGLKPGVGSVESRRKERDELRDNDNLTQLKGQMNQDGPSTNSLESASSGSGIAGRSAVDRERDFRRQLESLVRRDDIPEELKLGVREYFERIHENDSE